MDYVDTKVFWKTIALIKSVGGITEERGTLDSNTRKEYNRYFIKMVKG